jgi:hypothetical protein
MNDDSPHRLVLASGRFLSGVLLFIPTRLIGDIDAFGYAMLRTVRPAQVAS